MKLVKGDGEEEVCDEDDRIADDDAVCCRPSDPCRASFCDHTSIAGDGNDDDAEDKAFGDAAKKVEICDVEGEGVEEALGAHIVVVDRDDIAADHPHGAAENGEQGEHEGPCDETGGDQVPQRVDRHGAEGVDLFCDPHGAKFGAHGSADPTRHHEGCQDGAKLDHHCFCHHKACCRGKSFVGELEEGLGRQDHAGGEACDGDDGKREDADVVHLIADEGPQRGVF